MTFLFEIQGMERATSREDRALCRAEWDRLMREDADNFESISGEVVTLDAETAALIASVECATLVA